MDDCDSPSTCSSEVPSSSEACSTSSSAATSPGGSPATSPRGGGGSGPGVPALVLNRRGVPSLGLRANLAALPREDDPAANAPGTARQAPAGTVPRLAVPPLPSARGPAPPPPKPAAPAPPPSSQAALLSLDMLSPAFTLDLQADRQQRGGGGAAGSQLGQSCAARLGVPQERLRFYVLTEVAGPQALPPGCLRVAVEVTDSRFSLTALEQLLAENQHLAAPAAPAQQPQAPQEHEQVLAEVRALRGQNEALRQQLQRSESLRRKGRRAMLELREEFGKLSHELQQPRSSGIPADGGGAAFEFALQQKLMQQAPVAPRAEREGTPAAVDDARLL